jgi:hypothetical protein
MLQLRLDLLDSFLRGKGGDVSSFFKPGRLVIIDLSDPFVDGKPASSSFYGPVTHVVQQPLRRCCLMSVSGFLLSRRH